MPVNFIVEPSVAILNNSSHAASSITESLTTLIGAARIDKGNGVYADQSSLDGKFDPYLLAHSLDKTRTNYRISDDAPVNHAPYGILSNSFTSYAPNIGIDAYATLSAYNMLDIWACIPSSPLPANSPPSLLALNILSRASASVSGIEFSMSTGYKGWDTSSPSATTALFSGLVAALRLKLSSINNFDTQALLRQTSNNWANGYDAANYGYGDVDFDAAALRPHIFLQPPFAKVSLIEGNDVFLLLAAFRQDRRYFERVYLADPSYAWPIKDEYTQKDIDAAAMLSVTETNPSFSTSFDRYAVTAPPGNYHLIAFTTDGFGAYSRVESFCKIPVVIT
jgi:hypothetical protein